MSRHTEKLQLDLNGHFPGSARMYVNDPEFKTTYKQAPKTGFIQNISLGKEKKSFIMFKFWENSYIYIERASNRPRAEETYFTTPPTCFPSSIRRFHLMILKWSTDLVLGDKFSYGIWGN